jgi:enoyl-CoA hydratase/carnithine racemase
MSDSPLIRNLDRGVATLRLARPEARNALTGEMVAQFREALVWAKNEPEVRVVVLIGEGEAFCSGIDLHELETLHELDPRELVERIYGSFQGMVQAIIRLPKPVIAAINGDALGAGLDLCLACDIRVARATARFSALYVRIGLVPAMSGLLLLPRVVGLGTANRLAMTGDMIDAAEAARLGLIEVLAEDDQFSAAVEALASKLANGPTSVIGLIKTGLRHSIMPDMEAQLEFAAMLQAQAMQTEDHREALAAIKVRRKPEFRGR